MTSRKDRLRREASGGQGQRGTMAWKDLDESAWLAHNEKSKRFGYGPWDHDYKPGLAPTLGLLLDKYKRLAAAVLWTALWFAAGWWLGAVL